MDYFRDEVFFDNYNLTEAEKIDKMLNEKLPTVHHLEDLWAEKADFGIYMIIREDEKDDVAIQKVFDVKKQMELESGTNLPDIILVDAKPKKSASKE